ncbi:COX assembly mitochondrial protein homolog isoform X1 [Brienomyrus brachyistius]|uniref:COX assembly mitochondrial protein homolog isoform X1 n=1 Tax=Brienomyrus brachyistius TaxID=42636 RepID=UPI0020B42DA1|nr:COX assembly mitochondrial protein homolog isoform X1 [Brienomyrus brachyistius]
MSLDMKASKEGEPALRHVELDVLIPKLMREKARERCADKVEATRIPNFKKSANSNMLKRRRSMRRLASQQRTGNRNCPPACSARRRGHPRERHPSLSRSEMESGRLYSLRFWSEETILHWKSFSFGSGGPSQLRASLYTVCLFS